MKRAASVALTALPVLVLGLSAFPASAGVSLKKQTLRATGQVQHVVGRDLDGDGKNELLAVSREGKPSAPQRSLFVWKYGANGFLPAPSVRMRLPRRAVAVDACDVHPAPGREIVFLTSRGIEAYLPKGDGSYEKEPQLLLKVWSSLVFPDPADVPFVELCRTPVGGQGPELWIPSMSGIQVVRQVEGKLEKAEVLNVRPQTRHLVPDEFRGPRVRNDYSVLTELAFPQLYSMDADGDGDEDCYATIEDRVWLFIRDGGVLGGEATSKRYFDLRTDEEWRENKYRLRVFIADMNGDKKPDAVPVKMTGSLAKLKTDTRVYLGVGASGFAQLPTATRKGDGYAIPEAVTDVDGDGRAEILEPRLDTSPLAIGRLVVTGNVKMDFHALRLSGRSFREGEEMSLLFAFDPGGSGVKGTLPLLGGDVDGDGVVDRVDLGQGTTVAVVRGRKGDPAFEEDPAFEGTVVSTRKAAWFYARDGKPASIVVFFPKHTEEGGKIVVFWNPKGA